jgi:hypothetical protein
MKALHRRLAALERVLLPPPQEEAVFAVAVDTPYGDLARVGGRWVACGVQPLLSRNCPPKVYVGRAPEVEE